MGPSSSEPDLTLSATFAELAALDLGLPPGGPAGRWPVGTFAASEPSGLSDGDNED
jgi:hypothetical protein